MGMSKLTFLTNNLIGDANISLQTGSQNSQFPLDNIKIAFSSKVFRSTGSSCAILIDCLVPSPVDTFCVRGDVSEGALGFDTCVLKGSATTDFSSSTPITIDLSEEHNFGFKQFTEVSYRYWLIELTGSAFCELSNVYLGKKTEFLHNDINTQSFSFGDIDNVSIQKNKYGQKFINQYNFIQELSGNINLVTPSELAVLREIYLNHGRHIPIWFMLDPLGEMPVEDSEFLFSGFFYLEQDFQFKAVTVGLYTVNLVLTEVT